MNREQGRTKGFSMTELLIVIAVIAIIAMVAGPALARLMPIQRLRGEAQNVATFMRQARLTAANTQKPIRVSLTCSGAGGNAANGNALSGPCRLRQDTAQYKDGVLEEWITRPSSSHDLARQVDLEASSNQAPTGCPTAPNTPEGVVWVIFMPNGQTYSHPCPFSINMSANDLRGQAAPTWQLAVNNAGRTVLTPSRRP